MATRELNMTYGWYCISIGKHCSKHSRRVIKQSFKDLPFQYGEQGNSGQPSH